MSGQTARNIRAPRQPQTWSDVEPEVAHYCWHEPGTASCNLDSNGGGGFESKMHSYSPGADATTMGTVLDRFRVADQLMPMQTVRYELHVVETPTIWGPSKIDAQVPKGKDRPSASQVLRAAYGTQACKYDDSAPGGEHLLKAAKAAYLKAAQMTPARARPRRLNSLMARFDREFGK